MHAACWAPSLVHTGQGVMQTCARERAVGISDTVRQATHAPWVPGRHQRAVQGPVRARLRSGGVSMAGQKPMCGQPTVCRWSLVKPGNTACAVQPLGLVMAS